MNLCNYLANFLFLVVSGTVVSAVEDDYNIRNEEILENRMSTATHMLQPLLDQDVMTFKLYTRFYPNGKKLPAIGPLENITDVYLPTNIIVHGFNSSGERTSWKGIKDAYLKVSDCNVIIVDWTPISSDYTTAVKQTRNLAIVLAKLVDKFICSGADPKRIHLIGHSVGAHIAGVAGRLLQNETIARVTGLDPSKLLFNFEKRRNMIGNDSADMVDIIHTSSMYGLNKPVGTVDFFPNNGDYQPGCQLSTSASLFPIQSDPNCDHRRSWEYFRDSILYDNMFPAKKCEDYKNFEQGKCEEKIEYMGEYASPSITGKYYLRVMQYKSPPAHALDKN